MLCKIGIEILKPDDCLERLECQRYNCSCAIPVSMSGCYGRARLRPTRCSILPILFALQSHSSSIAGFSTGDNYCLVYSFIFLARSTIHSCRKRACYVNDMVQEITNLHVRHICPFLVASGSPWTIPSATYSHLLQPTRRSGRRQRDLSIYSCEI